MSDQAAIHRQLKIKSGVASRLSKEHNLYRTEAEQQKRKLDKYIAENGDHWEVGNATRMLDEANRMIEDSAKRLGAAVDVLRAYIITVKKEPAFAEDDELKKAEEVLQMTSV
ncbi:tubulin binding cofactor A [Athelia psychrophila]|uniref:Tubulin-specific chaperone A n=1 Tax=Athelia psychrophila TaxID=1759441 RepID=A0A166S2F9_9AGAM|nr:tubulin binding cofactor A [Fibularhizoctonia sp. CBS 109695]